MSKQYKNSIPSDTVFVELSDNIYKSINMPGFDYWVSIDGKVINNRKQLVKSKPDKWGKPYVKLRNYDKLKYVYVKRLLFQAWRNDDYRVEKSVVFKDSDSSNIILYNLDIGENWTQGAG